jgi:hypothetical protein
VSAGLSVERSINASMSHRQLIIEALFYEAVVEVPLGKERSILYCHT